METETLLASSDWISAGGLYLILVGIALLITELFVTSFGLLGFAGTTAILIGIIQLHQTGYIETLPVSENILMTGVFIGVALSALGGWYSWQLYKKKNTTGTESMIGETTKILEWKEKVGRVQIQGETWQAYSDETLHLKKDDCALVERIDGLKIKIIPKN
ncbi:MAG: NfeD family protein [Alphaproteobacteria bacterium]|nr:NfeD family protein [Alphaproteobacteria bacterium]